MKMSPDRARGMAAHTVDDFYEAKLFYIDEQLAAHDRDILLHQQKLKGLIRSRGRLKSARHKIATARKAHA